MARKLEIRRRFKADFKKLAVHPEYDRADFVQMLDDFIEFDALPPHYSEHQLEKRAVNWAGFNECHLSADIVVIFKRRPALVILHRVGGHEVLSPPPPQARRRQAG